MDIKNMQIYRENLQLWGSFGTGQGTKTDEFSEKFQTAFDLPPQFLENFGENFYNGYGMDAYMQGGMRAR